MLALTQSLDAVLIILIILIQLKHLAEIENKDLEKQNLILTYEFPFKSKTIYSKLNSIMKIFIYIVMPWKRNEKISKKFV